MQSHLVLSQAILFTSLQLFPFSNASLWTDLRHVCLGLPLLLFPWGFHFAQQLNEFISTRIPDYEVTNILTKCANKNKISQNLTNSTCASFSTRYNKNENL